MEHPRKGFAALLLFLVLLLPLAADQMKYPWQQNGTQCRAIGENDLPAGKACEIDTLILNRVGGSVSMLSTPGPAAATKACIGIMKPQTVVEA